MLPYSHLNQASNVQYSLSERDGDQSHPPDLFTLASGPYSQPFQPCPVRINNLQDRCHMIRQHPLQHHSSEQFMISAGNTLMNDDNGGVDNLKLPLCDHYVKEEREYVPSFKWMPPKSKMPIMRKTLCNKSDPGVTSHARPIPVQVSLGLSQKQIIQDFGTGNDSNSPLDIIRVCADCRTTKTPVWRSGPCGPKTLCNACGIRQRKARRAMAATAVSSGLLPPRHALTVPANMRKHQKKLDAMPIKKRCKPPDTARTTAQAKLCLEDATLSLSTSPTFDRVFPQDVRNAAILLMSLSRGIIRS